MFRRMRKFIERHAPKFQMGITAIGTGITIATIMALFAAGQTMFAIGLTTWAISCAVVGTVVSFQAEQTAAVAV